MTIMPDSQTNLAAAALAVALAALLCPLVQILQHLFGTADGFRRCQAETMGDWAQYTRLRWRKREFRLETLFTIPVLTVGPSDDLRGGDAQALGIDKVLARHYTPSDPNNPLKDIHATILTITGDNEDPATWLALLLQLYVMKMTTWDFLKHRKKVPPEKKTAYDEAWIRQKVCTGPCIRRQERSWDLMPPDVIRPFAVSNVGDIAVLGRRLGIRWTDFKPAEGIIRGEGSGRIITSVNVRSLGTMLHFMATDGSQSSISQDDHLHYPLAYSDDSKELYIPRPEADQMGFGILPGCKSLRLKDLKMSNGEEILDSMKSLGCSPLSLEVARANAERYSDWIPGWAGESFPPGCLLTSRGTDRSPR